MNKLMARIVAVVMAIAMLGTVSFAATADVADDNTSITTTAVAESMTGTTRTLMAYATDDNTDNVFDEDNDEIIALVQGTAAEVVGTIPVESSKVTKDYVVINYGDDQGNTDTITIKMVKGLVSVNVTIGDLKIVTTTYQNVAYATYTFVANAITDSTYGLHFYNSQKVDPANGKTPADVDDVPAGEIHGVQVNAPAAAKITGEGNVSFTAVIFGVEGTATLGAMPYINGNYIEQ